jgi:SAM-dependent methyltransferase
MAVPQLRVPMMLNATNMYDVDTHVAEIYDRTETKADDVALIRKLVGGRHGLCILEPFCGTGRILIPLAMDGHQVFGLDQAAGMLARARSKIATLPREVRDRVTLAQSDVTREAWPAGFDVVLLGGNCFYELATPEEQEYCIASAAVALKAGGHVFVDNDHLDGELDGEWRKPGVNTGRFPTGVCADGTRLESTTETIGFDGPARIWRARRTTTITFPDGRQVTREWLQQKHPVSAGEVEVWLVKHGFVIEQDLSVRTRLARGTFWARRNGSVCNARSGLTVSG